MIRSTCCLHCGASSEPWGGRSPDLFIAVDGNHLPQPKHSPGAASGGEDGDGRRISNELPTRLEDWVSVPPICCTNTPT